MSKEGSSSFQQKEVKIETVVEVGRYDEVSCIEFPNIVRSKYPLVKLMNPKLPHVPGKDRHPQKLLLEIYKENFYSIKKMYSLKHPNVLGCEYFQEADEKFCKMFNEKKNFTKKEDAKYNMVVIEKISGTLDGFIVNELNQLLIAREYMPSAKCTQLMLSIIDTFRFLHGMQIYHGNFSAESTPFVYDKGKVIVKLANFIEKNDDLELSQYQHLDWVDFGHFLDRILRACDNRMFVGHLNRAIEFFTNINIVQITNMDYELRQLDFFWTPEDRWVYARGLFSWCDEHESYLRMNNAGLVSMPWDNFKNSLGKSILKEMNNFRDKDGKKEYNSDYDNKDVISLLKFISGVYAHYNTLDVPELRGGLKNIDAFICVEFPDLFYNLRQIANEIGMPVV